MRVAFLTRYAPTYGSTRVRVTHYLPYLERAGIETRALNWAATSRGAVTRLALQAVRLARWADVVVLQKPHQPQWLINALATANSNIVVDFDDAVWAEQDDAPGRPHVKYGNRLRHAIARARVVTCGSEYLARWAREECPGADIEVIPNGLDLARYGAPPRRDADETRDHQLTVGWIGSPGAFLDFTPPVVAALRSVVASGRARFVVVSSRPLEPCGVLSGFAPWSPQEEVELLRTFDVGVMPLRDIERSRGRCGYKAIQYLAVGAPIVASPFGAVETVEHGVTGFIATTQAEWEERIGALLDDSSLRHELGRNARQRAEERFSLDVTAPKLIGALSRAEAGPRSEG